MRLQFRRGASAKRSATPRRARFYGSVAASGIALAAFSLHAADAQTYTYQNANGTFSTGFTPTLTTGSTTASLLFGGASYTATDDLLTAVTVNSLAFSNSGAVLLARSAAAGTANQIVFDGTAPSVTLGNGGIVTIALDALLNAVTTFTGAGTSVLSGVVSGGGGIVQSGTGMLQLTGTNTFTGGVTINSGVVNFATLANLGTGTITFGGGTLQNATGTTVDASARFAATNIGAIAIDTNGSNVTFGTALGSGDTGGLAKYGAGTLTLAQANTITGGTTVRSGTLALNFAGTGAPTADILTNSSLLTLSGGTLTATGKASTVNSQTFGGLRLNAGASAITGTIGTSGTVNLILGGITRNTGSVVNVTLPATGSITTTTANTAGTILGGWATVAGTNWAVSAGNGTTAGAITALGTYGTNYATATTATDFDATATGTFTPTGVNSLRFNTAAAVTSTLNGAFVIGSGGILKTATVAANASTITGGTSLTSGNGSDLIVNQYDTNAAGTLTIATPIVGAIGLTMAGGGTTILTAANTYSGATTVGAGVLQVGNGTTVGTLGTNTGAILDNGTLAINQSGAFTIANAISGTGGFLQTGAGTTTLSGANGYTGTTTIAAGTLLLGSAASLPATSIITLNGTGTLDLGGSAATAAGLTGGATTTAYTGTIRNGSLTIAGVTGLNVVTLNTGVTTAKLDLSGLSAFTFNEPTQSINVYGNATGSGSNAAPTTITQLTLSSGTNSLTASAINLGANGNGASPFPLDRLDLGTANTINTATIVAGGYRGNGLLDFQSGLTNPSVIFRGVGGGVTPVTLFTIGQSASGAGSNTASADFTNAGGTGVGTIDLIATGLVVAQETTGNTNHTATATFSMGLGTLNVGGLVVAQDTGNTTSHTSTGTFTQNQGTVLANNVSLGQDTYTTTATAPTLIATYNLGTATTTAILAATNISLNINSTTGAALTTTPNAASRGTINFNNGTIENYDPALGQSGSAGAAGGPTTAQNLVLQGTSGGGGTVGSKTLTLNLASTGTQTFFAEPGFSITEGSTALIQGTGTFVVAGGGTVYLNAANTFTGTTAVSSGTLDLGNSSALSGSTLTTGGVTFDSSVSANAFTLGGLSGSANYPLVNTASTPIALSVGNNNGSTTYSGAFSGAGTLTKVGTGVLTLTGTNTYTGGTTTVTAGTLRAGTAASIPGASTTALSLGATGTFDANGQYLAARGSSGGGLALSGLTVASGGTLNFNLSSTSSDQLTFTGPATSAGGKISIGAVTGATSLTPGMYFLATDASGDLSGFSLANPALKVGGLSYPLTLTATANSDILTVGAGLLGTAYWTGSQNAVWNTGGGGANTNFSTDAAGTSNTLALPNASTDVNFTANTAGNLTNTLGQDFTINSLTLGVGAAATSSVTIGGTNTLTLNAGLGSYAAGTGIVVAGSAAQTISANVALGANQTWTNGGTGLFTVSGSVNANNNTLTLTGSGAQTIGGAIGNIAALTLSGAGAETIGGSLSDSGSLTLSGTGAETIAGTSTVAGVLTLAGTGTQTISGAIAGPTAINISGTNPVTISGAITSGGALTQGDTGTVVLSGDNSNFSGTVAQNAGTLALNSPTALGTGTLAITAGTVDNTSGAAVTLTTNNPQSWSGNFTFGGTNALNLGTGSVSVAAAVTTVTVNGTSPVTIGGTVTAANPLTFTGPGILNLTGTGSSYNKFTLNGGITLNWSGTGTTAQSYTGVGDGTAATLNVTGGSLTSNSGSGFFIGNGSMSATTVSGGTLTVNTSNQTVSIGDGYNNNGNGTGTLTLTGTGIFTTGTTTGGFYLGNTHAGIGTVELDTGATLATNRTIGSSTTSTATTGTGGNGVFNFNGGTLQATGTALAITTLAGGTFTANVRNNGAIVDTNGFNDTIAQPLVHSTIGGDAATDGGLTKVGVGTLTLTGANTYNGGTKINAGTLQFGNNGTTGTLPAGAVADNGTLAFNRTDSVTVANAISGTGAVTQSGTGTVTLTGANTYSGGTTVNAGTLVAGGTALGAGPATIASGATLGVGEALNTTSAPITTHTLSAQSLTAAPGSATSLLTFNLGASGTNDVFNLTATSGDSLTLSSSGTFNIGFASATGASLGAGSYRLLSFATAENKNDLPTDPTTVFSAAPQGNLTTISNPIFSYTTDGAGNITGLALTIAGAASLPEPSSVALALLGLSGIAARKLRRPRSTR